jgi:hypothetical protein
MSETPDISQVELANLVKQYNAAQLQKNTQTTAVPQATTAEPQTLVSGITSGVSEGSHALLADTSKLLSKNSALFSSFFVSVVVLSLIMASSALIGFSEYISLGDQKIIGAHLGIFAIFSILNFVLLINNHYNESNLSFIKSVWYSIYVTSTTHTSTSYGDITPLSDTAKLSALTHQWFVYFLTAGFIVFNAQKLSF